MERFVYQQVANFLLVTDKGYRLGLAKEIPSLLFQHMDGFLQQLLANEYSREECNFALHPGGNTDFCGLYCRQEHFEIVGGGSKIEQAANQMVLASHATNWQLQFEHNWIRFGAIAARH